MILTKEKKENQVIDLYFNEKKPYRHISQILRMSLRDISTIIKKEEQKRGVGSPSDTASETRTEQLHPSLIEVSAYKLFLEGRSGTSSYRSEYNTARCDTISKRILEAEAITSYKSGI
jgi:hypothetical protein